MKIEGYEEISEEEYFELPMMEKKGIMYDDEDKSHHFKKAQKFPIVFEDKLSGSGFAFEVLEHGLIKIRNKATEDYFLLDKEDIKLFEMAKEVMKKSEIN